MRVLVVRDRPGTLNDPDRLSSPGVLPDRTRPRAVVPASARSPRIAIAYAGDLEAVAKAVATGAIGLGAETRTCALSDVSASEQAADDVQTREFIALLRWCDGLALGTPTAGGAPAPVLLELVARTRPGWQDGTLVEKAVTIFTDHPEAPASDALVLPLCGALYHLGAVLIGPKDFELAAVAPAHPDRIHEGAEYAGRRLTRLAGIIAAARARRAQFEL